MNTHSLARLVVLALLSLWLPLSVACERANSPENSAPPSFISGEFAYIPFGNQIRVIDISDPRQPEQVGSYVTGGLFYNVQAVGDWLVASQYYGYDPTTGADIESAVLVLSLSDPRQPTLTATLPVTFAPQSLLWHGSYLYIADWETTAVYDMTDPATPVLVITWPERFDKLTAMADTLYASRSGCNFRTGWCESAVREIPLPPTADLGRIYEFENLPIWNIQAQEEMLYVAGNALSAVPLNGLAHLRDYLGSNPSGYGALMQQTADRLYLSWANDLVVYDTADPSQPAYLYEITAASDETYFTHSAINGDYLYLVSPYALHIYDLTGEEVYGAALVSFE